MKYIITQDQKNKLINVMTQLLEDDFSNSNVICGIKIYGVDDEDNDKLSYDIHVFYNMKLMRNAGIVGFTIVTKKRIDKLLYNWFRLTDDNYYITTLFKEC